MDPFHISRFLSSGSRHSWVNLKSSDWESILFILATELLCLRINHDDNFKINSVFDREIKIAQLTDDTTLFLEDKNQLPKALELVERFSCASGLKLNASKCEFMSIHDMDDVFLGGIPVKKSFKYLGIHITKN